MDIKQSDFWWLTLEEVSRYKYTCLCYQEPYSDEPNSDKDPYSSPRYFSIDANGHLSSEMKYYPLEFIDYWRQYNNNINVFRSVCLYHDEHNGERLYGPFSIDIDREDGSYEEGYMQNLNKALEDARRLTLGYLCKLKETDFRIFFTGHKGFNIEVRPKAVSIIAVKNRREQFDSKLEDINRAFRCSKEQRFIDKMHNEIRLHNSINRWVTNKGQLMNRMKFGLSIYELKNMTAEEICQKSEKLARDYLAVG